MATNLTIVCPSYNEAEVLPDSIEKLKNLLDDLIGKKLIARSSSAIIVNDGSTDESWNIIKKSHDNDARIKAVNLAFNSGHQNAIMAGMMAAKDNCDAVITMDVDLQDDLACVEKMLEEYKQGYDVVYGVKADRSSDAVIKRLTAKGFYKFQKAMGVNAIENHSDFRLLSNKVLQTLSGYHENNLYLRGIIPSLGFKSAQVQDNISDRKAGKSKYTTKKMLNLATDGITSFSSRPLKIVFWVGIIFLIVALINAIDVVVALCNGTAAPGWSQLMLSLWFIGGVLMISLGVVGTYIGRIYSEVKNRPQYIISETLD